MVVCVNEIFNYLKRGETILKGLKRFHFCRWKQIRRQSRNQKGLHFNTFNVTGETAYIHDKSAMRHGKPHQCCRN